MRLRIAAEVAGALSYMHSSASIPIYNQDIKSTSIMLDEKYKAKIADFGISKFVAIDQTHATTQVQGTFGYLDPKNFRSCQFTDKSDVYSSSVVLTELLTSQKPISMVRPEEYRGLATYYILSMEEYHLVDILEGKEEEIMAVVFLAKRWLDLKGKRRPSMKEAAMELERIRMLRNPSCGVQNHSDIDFSSNSIGWDDAWTSMRSDLDVDLISFPDVHPLLDIESW
ncbi:wall-associated receptor kinase-like 22 [Eucalyptus grandis]|uniref:wall-associated receptor kinase-like 22 n=1 Tax=Eucalyptus grandis TaxID=71139 RepID=UPI00192EC7D1|nr:wall-associated receptor kinase-like 22 [Eucalyptus grandis]